MGNITFSMGRELEDKLRDSLGRYRKGALGEALSQGAQMWIDKKLQKNSRGSRNSKKFRSKR